MPKSQTIEWKELNGIKVDKENDSVFFNDECHKYYDKETMQTYISVTTLIKNYENEFDEDFWTSYKALEELLAADYWEHLQKKLLATKKFHESYLEQYNVDQKKFYEKKQEILESYQKKRDDACKKGTEKHLAKEMLMYGKETYDLTNYNLPEIKGNYVCKEDYYELSVPKAIYPEYLISAKLFNGELLIAGQIDCLIKDDDDFIILDYKTNSAIKKRSYFDKKRKKSTMMKFPLNNLEDCNWNHYQLQLSLYAYLLEQIKPGCNIKKLQLVHLKDDGKEEIMECSYLKSDVERMLKHYIKTTKIQKELKKIEPVKIG